MKDSIKWLDDLGEKLTELDRESLCFIRSVDSKKQAIIDEALNKNIKYPIGYQFIHPKYGAAKIVNIKFIYNKQGSLIGDKSIYDNPYLFWSDVISFYKPYFMYECKLQVEGIDNLVTTTVPEHIIDESVISFNNNLLKVVA